MVVVVFDICLHSDFFGIFPDLSSLVRSSVFDSTADDDDDADVAVADDAVVSVLFKETFSVFCCCSLI